MDLNNFPEYSSVDIGGMYQSIRGLPDQLLIAYQAGEGYPLPEQKKIKSVVIAGMGGSAIAGDLTAACFSSDLRLPVIVIRDYNLPGWISGESCMVICSSHSGNTEETNSILTEAIDRGCTSLVITTGGLLEKTARSKDVPVWKFNHQGQPRTAVGWSFGLLMRLFERLEFIPYQSGGIENAVAAMKGLLSQNHAEIPTAQNPAKRLAGQLVDQYVSIFAAEHLAPVARRWKTQINELAKSWCQFEYLPEADHNTLAGILKPEVILPKVFTVFLQSSKYHPRNQQRVDLTFTEFMIAGIGTDKIDFHGKDKLTEMWSAVLFGDLTAFYLAMYYDVDPTPVDAIESLKQQLG